MTWEEMSRQSFWAAQELRRKGLWRSCISRSYYAAYAAITATLPPEKIPGRWMNPTHSSLPKLISNHGKLSKASRSKINRIIRILRMLREDSDYRPHTSVGKSEAILALVNASEILGDLEIL
ncbi:MAG: HEPN domain-containing protein [Candidatus Omnitrophica bacterium]|nr:HEPN domain-containing protein [Candidatus Omnitrophota bacterium]